MRGGSLSFHTVRAVSAGVRIFARDAALEIGVSLRDWASCHSHVDLQLTVSPSAEKKVEDHVSLQNHSQRRFTSRLNESRRAGA